MKKTSNNFFAAIKLINKVEKKSKTFGEFEKTVNSSKDIIALTTKWTRHILIQRVAHHFEN